MVPAAPAGLKSPYPPHDVKWERSRVMSEEVARGRIDTFDVYVPALAALPPVPHDEIAVAAYFRWLARGAPMSGDGAMGDWLEAEQDLLWGQVPSLPLPDGRPGKLDSRMAMK